MILKEAKNDTLSKKIKLSLKEKWTGISGMTGIVVEKQAVPVEEIAAMRRSTFIESPGSEEIKEERI